MSDVHRELQVMRQQYDVELQGLREVRDWLDGWVREGQAIERQLERNAQTMMRTQAQLQKLIDRIEANGADDADWWKNGEPPL